MAATDKIVGNPQSYMVCIRQTVFTLEWFSLLDPVSGSPMREFVPPGLSYIVLFH